MTGKGFLIFPDFSSFPWPERTLKKTNIYLHCEVYRAQLGVRGLKLPKYHFSSLQINKKLQENNPDEKGFWSFLESLQEKNGVRMCNLVFLQPSSKHGWFLCIRLVCQTKWNYTPSVWGGEGMRCVKSVSNLSSAFFSLHFIFPVLSFVSSFCGERFLHFYFILIPFTLLL